MTLGRYLRLVLTQDAGVAALAGDRVYSEFAPQAPDPSPFVVFAEVAGEEDYALDGPTGARRASVEVTSWAKKRSEATALGLAVKKALSGHAGGSAGLHCQSVVFVTERWGLDPELPALFFTEQQYEVSLSGEA